MNMSSLTNLIALLITVVGYFMPGPFASMVFDTGLFALSGAITNWVAIHMLFEKVPYLYGSGVIPSRFEEFKGGIKQLIVSEFFTRAHIERFFQSNSANAAESLTSRIDFERVFEHLIEAIVESPMGNMLKMVGGRAALEPLKEPIIDKLKGVVTELANSPSPSGEGADFTSALIAQVEKIIDARLAELTPQMVKTIIEDMIRKHLGWLVVWGGVFGGLIGVAANLLGR
jgi:uncharacterized membrane protein YheB (UPF0754 family)